jgi:hypothetical protein
VTAPADRRHPEEEAVTTPRYLANQAVLQAAVKIERAVVDLLEQTADLKVGHDYVIETLIARLVVPKPWIIDYLNQQPDDANVQLAGALAAWGELWVKRVRR